jgi:hypothetical protein
MQLTGKTSYALGYEGEGGSWRSPWFWGGAGLAVALALSCATDNFPCDDDSYNGSGYRTGE